MSGTINGGPDYDVEYVGQRTNLPITTVTHNEKEEIEGEYEMQVYKRNSQLGTVESYIDTFDIAFKPATNNFLITKDDELVIGKFHAHYERYEWSSWDYTKENHKARWNGVDSLYLEHIIFPDANSFWTIPADTIKYKYWGRKL
jgi:hypothetical protein